MKAGGVHPRHTIKYKRRHNYGKQKKQRGSKHPLELFQLHFQLNLPDLAVLQRDFQQLK